MTPDQILSQAAEKCEMREAACERPLDYGQILLQAMNDQAAFALLSEYLNRQRPIIGE